MSYRSRHPDPHIWSRLALRSMKPPAHYGLVGATGVMEVNAPDGTEFFLLSGGMTPDERRGTFYCIEAPKTCPMRKLLELGQLSWVDFWTHKGWLLFMDAELGTDDEVLATYIPAGALPLWHIRRFEKLGSTSPYVLKHRCLELRINIYQTQIRAGLPGVDIEEAEREYCEFIAKYGHLWTNSAA